MINKCLQLVVFGVSCFVWSATGSAQESSAAASSADALISASLAAAKKIDDGQSVELWKEAPEFVKTLKPRPVFEQEVHEARASVGAVQQRSWASVTRIRFLEGSQTPPPGLYANVDLATHLTDGRTVYEKVTFRLEADGWRFVGYAPRQAQ